MPQKIPVVAGKVGPAFYPRASVELPYPLLAAVRLRYTISQASQLSESIAWGTLNRRGTRDGTQSVSRPYLTPYIKLERIGWGRGFARVSGSAIEARSAARPTGSL